MKHILVVDDEIILREYLTELLELEGFSTAGAGTLQEAMDAYTKQRPDMIICDMNLANETGLHVIAAMKVVDMQFAAPFLFISAEMTDEQRRQAEVAGARDFIRKPYDNAVLLQTVRSNLGATKT